MTGMDILEFGCVMTGIIVPALLIFVWFSTRNALIMQDLAEKRRISLERSKAAKARYTETSTGDSELSPWATELLGALGLSPESVFSDEIPPEIAKFLPLVKGFVKNGGIQKILGATQQPPELDPRNFI